MGFIFNTNFFFIIYFFIIIRFVDANLVFKGFFFILISSIIIYLPLKKLSIKSILYLTLFLFSFLIIGEKKNIIETSLVLKIHNQNDEFYKNVLSERNYKTIKNIYSEVYPDCIEDVTKCFQTNAPINEIGVSSDQLFFNINRNYTRKVNNINFDNLSNFRAQFINTIDGRINPNRFYKIDTPFFVKYTNLKNVDKLCFKGFLIIDFIDGRNQEYNTNKQICINDVKNKLQTVIGLNLENNNLSINTNQNSISIYIDDIFLFLYFVILIFNIQIKILKKSSKFFIPVLISIFIIFYISRYDLWFSAFNLFTLYFFGFEGGDGLAYINIVNQLYDSFINFDLIRVLQGGEDIFYYTPGLRYFLFLNKIICGDFYYFYFFLIFYIPKIIYSFLLTQFDKKTSFYLTLSFLLIPIFHHLGFSFYQFIRHAYRLFPEPLGYMFFLSALTIFYTNFEKKYLIMNLLFAISVFIRPNLVITVCAILIVKTINKKINIFKFENFFLLSCISMIYLFPLFHNIYFGNSFTLFTGYGSKILSISNLSNKDLSFFYEKIFSLNFIFMFLIFIPRLDVYLKIILFTQFFTLFFFDNNGRYYWVFWIISLILICHFIQLNLIKKWKYQKNYISS